MKHPEAAQRSPRKNSPVRLNRRAGQPVLLDPLPRKVRARLAFEHAANRAGTWLIRHDHYQAARLLWQACGLL